MLHRVNLEAIFHRIILLARLLIRRRGFWLRSLLCWVIGIMALTSDEGNSYDQRFQLRGDQSASKQIVLVTLKQSDLTAIYEKRMNSIGNVSELTDITDSFYWNKEIWLSLLKR